MSSGFLLVETAPGREGHVLDLLSRLPGVTHRAVIYPSAIAVKLETGAREAFDALTRELRALEGVTGTRLYRAKNT